MDLVLAHVISHDVIAHVISLDVARAITLHDAHMLHMSPCTYLSSPCTCLSRCSMSVIQTCRRHAGDMRHPRDMPHPRALLPVTPTLFLFHSHPCAARSLSLCVFRALSLSRVHSLGVHSLGEFDVVASVVILCHLVSHTILCHLVSHTSCVILCHLVSHTTFALSLFYLSFLPCYLSLYPHTIVCVHACVGVRVFASLRVFACLCLILYASIK